MFEGVIGILALLVIGYFMDPIRQKIIGFLNGKDILMNILIFIFIIFPIIWLLGAMIGFWDYEIKF